MKHLNRFNENSIPDEIKLKDITEEDKKFFDSVFADFIDSGAESELYESKVTYYNKGMSVSQEYYVWRYRIFLSLASMSSKKHNFRHGRVIDLVKYSTELNDLVLEVQSCFNKIKSEDDYKFIGSDIYTDDDAKVTLSYGGYREEQVPDKFNIVLNLYK